MRWLIVEDALRNREGHWFEYAKTFLEGLRALGDDVTILADKQAETFICNELEAHPVLPPSIWHRMGNRASAFTRYLRVPQHALRTWWTMRRFLIRDGGWDAIFVPTVLVHHLLGWYFLIQCNRSCRKSKTLLFFPNLPICLGEGNMPSWVGSPTTRLMRLLLQGLRGDIADGRVVLGVETRAMQKAFSQLIGLPVLYFPHPVQGLGISSAAGASNEIIHLSAYGPGRQEKGSDLLQQAILLYLSGNPSHQAKFVVQVVGDFMISDREGRRHAVQPELLERPEVEVIRDFFRTGEYAARLRNTQIMLLPYRQSSYGLRVSRIAIEAMVNGIPVVTTKGTTLWQQANEFGAALPCLDGSADSLHTSIIDAIDSYHGMRQRALERQKEAMNHFSVENFRNILFPS